MQLTNEEIARVFAMHFTSRFCEASSSGNIYGEGPAFHIVWEYAEGRPNMDLSTYKLKLTPLSKISDEDAIEVALLKSSLYLQVDVSSYYGTKEQGFTFYFRYQSSSRRRTEVISWNKLTPFQYQYLVSEGYAVPLFFAPNHWANGKTAIELGLAVQVSDTTEA